MQKPWLPARSNGMKVFTLVSLLHLSPFVQAQEANADRAEQIATLEKVLAIYSAKNHSMQLEIDRIQKLIGPDPSTADVPEPTLWAQAGEILQAVSAAWDEMQTKAARVELENLPIFELRSDISTKSTAGMIGMSELSSELATTLSTVDRIHSRIVTLSQDFNKNYPAFYRLTKAYFDCQNVSESQLSNCVRNSR